MKGDLISERLHIEVNGKCPVQLKNEGMTEF